MSAPRYAAMDRLWISAIEAMLGGMFARGRQMRKKQSARMFVAAGLLLALFALANVSALASWHASLLGHDDATADVAGFAHDHDWDTHAEGSHVELGHADSKPDTPSADLHNLTHAMVHGLNGIVPGMNLVISRMTGADQWFAGRSFTLAGIAAEALLRPPRA